MAEPDLRIFQKMIQRMLDEQAALREFLEVQFSMIRDRDYRLEGHDVELRAVESMLGGHERRLAALETKAPAE